MQHNARSSPNRRSSLSISEQLLNKGAVHREDGIDHVNINQRAKTRLGCIASMEWKSNFFIPYLGDFSSPRAFVCWLVSQNDGYRFDPPMGPVDGVSNAEYHHLLLFAKYFHLCSQAGVIRNATALFELPWVSYHTLPGGQVRQYHRWQSYPETVQKMCQYIETADITSPPCSQFSPEVMATVNKWLELMATANGSEFTPYEELEAIAKTKPKQKPKHKRKEGQGQSEAFNNILAVTEEKYAAGEAQATSSEAAPTGDTAEAVESQTADSTVSPVDNVEVKTVYETTSLPRTETPDITDSVSTDTVEATVSAD